MKKFIVSLLAAVVLMSCTKTLYTQDQVMARYTTKDDVIHKFGLPTDKRHQGDITEFIYDRKALSAHSAYTVNSAEAPRLDTFQVYGGAAGNGLTVGSIPPYKKYVKFIFDNHDHVITWQTQRINMAEKKIMPGKTILLIASLIALTVGFGRLALYSMN